MIRLLHAARGWKRAFQGELRDTPETRWHPIHSQQVIKIAQPLLRIKRSFAIDPLKSIGNNTLKHRGTRKGNKTPHQSRHTCTNCRAINDEHHRRTEHASERRISYRRATISCTIIETTRTIDYNDVCAASRLPNHGTHLLC
jgi:hypothetical protein